MKTNRKQTGFSYIEVLVATILISLTLIPALQTLESSLNSSKIHETQTKQYFYLHSKLEEVLAQSFDALDAAAIVAGSPTVPTSYSDAVGATDRRIVYLSKYDGDDADSDGDPFTGVDDDLLWVQVVIEATDHSFETLTHR